MAHQVVRAALLLLVIVAVEASAPPPRGVTIGYATYQGTGCNYYNSNLFRSDDYTTVGFLLDGMVAATSSLAARRANCAISFSLHDPGGRSVAITKATVSGFADINHDSRGTYEVKYCFAGQTGTATIERKIEGPYVGSFKYTDDFLTVVSSECSNAVNVLNVKTVVRVDGPKALMGMDGNDNKFKISLNLRWSRCS
ncbi:hypothetical protein CBR_g47964 [Chara braunii]|uniref:Uncharacterized protein n=1 Tax=Chara braunii TaxID=69332 RepID=A0A388M1Q6_CHABU|nr:hypothetical protein CBR_g47964 [Chara braunii]|eukprot:GBG88494.1 hypothetical protein CBR_g47964 [Chara braunii]